MVLPFSAFGRYNHGENVLDIGLTSHKKCVDNVNIVEPLGRSDCNQIHVFIKENESGIEKYDT